MLSLKRVLKHGKLLIFKCQDFCSGRKQYFILSLIHFMTRELNYSFRDLFILVSNKRMTNKSVIKQQQHARKHHCYFVVLKNNKRLDKIKKG